MTITRRQFLRRSALTAAAVTAPHPVMRAMFGIGVAHAAPSDAIFVLVQLEGGNDGLNTVVPIDGAQRTLYQTKRPTLGIPTADLAATEIDADPTHGNRLALHPSMTALSALYDAGKVAVVNGVGYANQSLSHFRSEDIWFGGIPSNAPFATGWFGRHLDATTSPADIVAVCMNEIMNPLFLSTGSNVLAVRRLSDFVIPDDPEYPDLAAKKAALQAMYAVESDPLETSDLQLNIGTGGDAMLGKIDVYALVDTSWPSNLNGQSNQLANRLKEVASIIRYDASSPPSPTGARFFHVRLGGFDTHTQQGTLIGAQPVRLQRVSDAIAAFYEDMVDLGVANKVVILTFSEFGRRAAESGGIGTDHGAAAPLFVVGDPVAGGIYGGVPDLGDLDGSGNLKYHTDFRRVYATIIDDWLNGDHVPLLAGGPYATIPFIA
jgi:uncharacterized protein (DUF1501 family)